MSSGQRLYGSGIVADDDDDDDGAQNQSDIETLREQLATTWQARKLPAPAPATAPAPAPASVVLPSAGVSSPASPRAADSVTTSTNSSVERGEPPLKRRLVRRYGSSGVEGSRQDDFKQETERDEELSVAAKVSPSSEIERNGHERPPPVLKQQHNSLAHPAQAIAERPDPAARASNAQPRRQFVDLTDDNTPPPPPMLHTSVHRSESVRINTTTAQHRRIEPGPHRFMPWTSPPGPGSARVSPPPRKFINYAAAQQQPDPKNTATHGRTADVRARVNNAPTSKTPSTNAIMRNNTQPASGSSFGTPASSATVSETPKSSAPASDSQSVANELSLKVASVYDLAEEHGTDKTIELISILYTSSPLQNLNRSRPSIFSTKEDRLIKHLKEDLNLRWDLIARFLPYRPSWMSIQSHYSNKIKERPPKPAQAADLNPRLSAQLPSLQYMPNQTDGAQEEHVRRSTRLIGSVVPGQYYVPPPLLSPPPFSTQSEEPSQEQKQQLQPTESDSVDSRHLQGVAQNQLLDNWLRGRISTRQVNTATLVPRCQSMAALEQERDAAAQSSMIFRLPRHSRKSIDIPRPYLSEQERYYLDENPDVWKHEAPAPWHGATVHLDFTAEEMGSLCDAACDVLDEDEISIEGKTAERLWTLIVDTPPEVRQKIAARVIRQANFINRAVEDIEKYLLDLNGSSPSGLRAKAKTLQPRSRSNRNTTLRRRELGLASIGRVDSEYEDLGPALQFIGTSSDVNVVSWCPDGNKFVVGSAALTDDSSMQYNRPNNLLLGNVAEKSLWELAQHSTKREPLRGINARHEMMATQDPLLYHSISAAQFEPSGRYLITAGYDSTAIIWDITRSRPKAETLFPHLSPIDVLAVNSTGLFATGSKPSPSRATAPIRIFRYDTEASQNHILDDRHGGLINHGLPAQEARSNASERGESSGIDRKMRKLYSQRGSDLVEPSSLRFNPSWGGPEKYLLAGFCSRKGEHGPGEVSIWDVTRSDAVLHSLPTPSVFDVAWSPTRFGTFALGCSVGLHNNVNRGTRSVVRLYDSLRSEFGEFLINKSKTCELECPALDMNDLVFCPADENLVSVGCTDGRSYVWDLRNPNEILHALEHGPTLTIHNPDELLERADTGVRFLSWGHDNRYLYSGSSDGAVVQWDPYRSQEDVHVQDIVRLETGIMSGAFSPDHTSLLLGDIRGSVSLLSVGADREPSLSMRSAETFALHEATREKVKLYKRRKIKAKHPEEAQHEAALAAKELLDSGKIVLRPFGNLPIRQAVQGPRYEQINASIEAPEASDMRRTAQDFQDKLRLHEREPLCPCTQGLVLTQDEFGDSGCWRHRIPAAVRFDSKAQIEYAKQDSAPAGPTQDQQDSCLRCSNKTLTTLSDDLVACSTCGTQWERNVLGYRVLVTAARKPMTNTTNKSSRRRLEEYEIVEISIDSKQNTPFAPEAESLELDADQREHYMSNAV